MFKNETKNTASCTCCRKSKTDKLYRELELRKLDDRVYISGVVQFLRFGARVSVHCSGRPQWRWRAILTSLVRGVAIVRRTGGVQGRLSYRQLGRGLSCSLLWPRPLGRRRSLGLLWWRPPGPLAYATAGFVAVVVGQSVIEKVHRDQDQQDSQKPLCHATAVHANVHIWSENVCVL